MKKKLFLFTDSRGYHKAKGTTHRLYTQLLQADPRLEVESYICPYKWTTLVDFIALAKEKDLTKYDYVLLHAGIVDQSPRPRTSAVSELYNPKEVSDEQDPAKIGPHGRIVNRKKGILDELFGEKEMQKHFDQTFQTKYKGDDTINLYSIEMMQEVIIPYLQSIPNLIFIGANNFSPGWKGDYPGERPENITIIENYSKLLCRSIPKSINLHCWSSERVREYTCDNIHFTQPGNTWVYQRVQEALGLKQKSVREWKNDLPTEEGNVPWPLHDVGGETGIRLEMPTIIDEQEQAEVRKQCGIESGSIACLIIGYSGRSGDDSRLRNLTFLLKWFKHFYGDLFDVLVVEQDKERLLNEDDLPKWVRYEFLYNPAAFNRGWVFNVAVKHLTNSKVIGLCDTDILPGSNFLKCVLDCYGDYEAISPCRSLYYSDDAQTQHVTRTMDYSGMAVNEQTLRNPTSLGGGMLFITRETYLDIGGFEQYIGYGCEDRAMDVTLLNHLPEGKVRMDSHAYFHQNHPKSASEREFFGDIYSHLVQNYGCQYFPSLTYLDYIHRYCQHESPEKTGQMRDIRKHRIGIPNMYEHNKFVTINGLPPEKGEATYFVGEKEEGIPNKLNSVATYLEMEELTGKFANAWAPAPKEDERDPDCEQLAFFYNRFAGQRCFIIGNGPSLNEIDLKKLNGEYSFGVNAFYYKTQETGFKPTFYVVEDSSVIKENVDEIVKFDTPFKFFPTIYRKLHPKRNGTYFFKLNRGFYEKRSPNYAIPRFSLDAADKLFCGQSVTYINLQLAYFMGFSEVYLVGMDFSYYIPKSHSRVGDVLTSDTDDPNHFHKDYFGKGKTWKDPKLDRVLLNYKMANLVYQSAGRKIINATVGGKLEVFPRVNFNDLFDEENATINPAGLDLTRPEDVGIFTKPSTQKVPSPTGSKPAEAASPKSESAKNKKPVTEKQSPKQSEGNLTNKLQNMIANRDEIIAEDKDAYSKTYLKLVESQRKIDDLHARLKLKNQECDALMQKCKILKTI